MEPVKGLTGAFDEELEDRSIGFVEGKKCQRVQQLEGSSHSLQFENRVDTDISTVACK